MRLAYAKFVTKVIRLHRGELRKPFVKSFVNRTVRLPLSVDLIASASYWPQIIDKQRKQEEDC